MKSVTTIFLGFHNYAARDGGGGYNIVLTYFLISQSEGAASENSETSWENAIKQAFKPVQSRSIEADAHDTESNADENTQHANC